MKFGIKITEECQGRDFEEQAENCLGKLTEIVRASNAEGSILISASFFIKAEDYGEFEQRKVLLSSMIRSRIEVPAAILSQAPASGAFIALELYFLSAEASLKTALVNQADQEYLLVEAVDCRLMVVNGLFHPTGRSGVGAAAEKVF